MADAEDRKQKLIGDIMKNSIEIENPRTLYRKAYAQDNSIEWKDVATFWRARQKFAYKGYNSFVANLPREQYHIDVAYMQPMMKAIMEEKDPDKVDDTIKKMEWKFCFICIDAFSKKVFARAQRNNNQEECRESLVRALNDMGVSKQIYTDQGTEFQGKFHAFLEEQGVEHIQTKTHAVFAERFIRFMKTQMDIKIDKVEEAGMWYVWLLAITKYYNNNPQGTTKMSPNEAQDDRNAMSVKANIVMQSKHMRRYPPLRVGDMVKVYKKPPTRNYERSYTNKWDGPYKIEKITMKSNLTYYHVQDNAKPMLRHELLKM
jgi:transposase InsO family protein